MRLPMRLYSVDAKSKAVELGATARRESHIVDPDNYASALGVGRQRHEAGGQGALHRSVSQPRGRMSRRTAPRHRLAPPFPGCVRGQHLSLLSYIRSPISGIS